MAMTLTGKLAFVSLAACLCPAMEATVTLPAIISDHATLQRSAATALWGTATPGAKISASLAGSSAETVARADGKWELKLDLSKASPGPHELLVEGDGCKLPVKDVVVGDLWLCSGQSNMAFELQGATGGKEVAAKAADPLLRQFKVKSGSSEVPLGELQGTWTVAAPKTAGAFTAVGFYFGAALRRELGVPIGLVNASYPGSSVDAWTPQAGLDTGALDKRQEYLALPKSFAAYQTRYAEWSARHDRKDAAAAPEAFAAPEADLSSWTEVQMPGPVAKADLPDAGAVWLRRTVDVVPAEAGKRIRLNLGERSFGSVYWNGKQIDELRPDLLRLAPNWEEPWTVYVPTELVKAGKATLAIRLFSPAGNAGLRFDPKKAPNLTGTWLAKAERALPSLSDAGKREFPGMPPVKYFYDFFMPSSLFDAMLNPLRPCRFKGVVWYQGEADTHVAVRYRERFSKLIQNWRGVWGEDLPFYFCQLPNFGMRQEPGAKSQWAELREAQTMTLALPKTGQAILLDTADGTLHPGNKRDPGERLALLALAETYGKNVAGSGPSFAAVSFADGNATLRFDHAEGLTAKGGEPRGFALRSPDGQWRWAKAKITPDGQVVVWREDVPRPDAVRYGWADNPDCNLYNQAGLPAVPFRTDRQEDGK